MRSLLIVVFLICLSTTTGQICEGKFDDTITGECLPPDSCQGTVLAAENCELKGCCVPGNISSPTCIMPNQFYTLYNTSRARYVLAALNAGINAAGICTNCQAKAAFLAIAATMTDDFQYDETPGVDRQFTSDDNKYGNNKPGDGSRFRRRGFFGIRGRAMYQLVQRRIPQYQVIANPQLAALVSYSAQIAAQLWQKPDLVNAPPLTSYADGTFYGLSMLWYKLYGNIDQLPEATKHYSTFLRLLECGGDLYPGQGSTCSYNATHQGLCTADCIRGLEDAGEYCGCSGGVGNQCPNSPPHIRCCLDTCTQELKMDLGFVLDASGSIGSSNYELQRRFTKDLLRRVNVGRNRTHVGIINYSTNLETLTWLDTDYDLEQKLRQVDRATYYGSGTNTAAALQQANVVFSEARGLRPEEEGAIPVLFVITDGASANRNLTIEAASVLKNKGIHLVSVGVGSQLDLVELHAICTPPASENYFPMSDYVALEQKLNQFTSKTCSEPTPLPENTTVTGDVGKDKYKFLKIKITIVGNKIMISIKLYNGKVKLFFSFTSRNPKDPNEFGDYQSLVSTTTTTTTTTTTRSPSSSSTRSTSTFRSALKQTKAVEDEMNLVIERSDTDVEYVYLGVKGVEEENKFEVKFDDCALVDCRSSARLLTMNFSILLIIVSAVLFLR